MAYDAFKAAMEAATGLSRDALHIYAALLIQIAAAAVLRRSLAHPVPWLCALVATVADELVEEAGKAIEPHDVVIAMLLPTALLVICRFAPALLLARRSVGADKRG